MIRLVLPIEPCAKGRPRADRRGFMYTDRKTRNAEAVVKRALIALHRGPQMSGPLKLTLRFVMRKPKSARREHPVVKPDLDNLQKLVCDSANGILWVDDSQVVECLARKVYDLVNPTPRIELEVSAV